MLNAPRGLNDPVCCKSSSLATTEAPRTSPSSRTGVRRIRPAIRSAAARTSSGPTVMGSHPTTAIDSSADERIRRAVLAGEGGDPGRRELTCPCVRRCRRRAAIRRPGRGRLLRGRGRPPVRRSLPVLGRVALRARAQRDRGRRRGGSCAGDLVRYPHRSGGPSRRAGRLDCALDRTGAARVLRHRGGDVGDPSGPRRHRQGRDRSSSRAATTVTPTPSSRTAEAAGSRRSASRARPASPPVPRATRWSHRSTTSVGSGPSSRRTKGTSPR